MAVKRIDTLGCHPLVLMKKLAAIGGLEILKEEKHVHDGVEYPYHIVAKVKDGLYVEAKDPIYEQATDATLLPMSITTSGFGSGSLMRLEADAQILGEYFTYAEAKRLSIAINSSSSIEAEAMGISILFSHFVSTHESYGNEYSILLGQSVQENGTSFIFGENRNRYQSGIMTIGGSPLLGGLSFESNLANYDSSPGGVKFSRLLKRIDPGGHEENAEGLAATVMSIESAKNVAWSPTHADVNSIMGYPMADALYFGFVKAYSQGKAGKPLVLSGTVVRVGNTIDSDGESIVSPSEWKTLPVFSSILSCDSGLFFCYDKASEASGMLGIVLVDTSKGNGMEGSFPAIYDSGVCCAVISSGGENTSILGGDGAPGATIPMQIHAPSPPLATDAVSGGPVVTDLFVHNSQEIRGVLPGLLGAPEALPVGSVGWLDGKRYQAHIPGRMLQIG